MANTTIATLQADVLSLQKTIESVAKTMEQLNTQIKTLTEAEEFDVFVQNELTPYFGEATSKNIVLLLQKCRRNNNYTYLTGAYQWKDIYGDLQKRQLLKLVSATYRIKYQNHVGNSNIPTLKSDLKYAKACPECGKLANAFHARLIAEGHMK